MLSLGTKYSVRDLFIMPVIGSVIMSSGPH